MDRDHTDSEGEDDDRDPTMEDIRKLICCHGSPRRTICHSTYSMTLPTPTRFGPSSADRFSGVTASGTLYDHRHCLKEANDALAREPQGANAPEDRQRR